jgi:glycosyltransferase involved in cell wall biosynthesis
MSEGSAMTVLLVDPSRFTVPYDAQLGEGLSQAGVRALWATRPLRSHESEELPSAATHAIFYRRLDRPRAVPRFAQGPLKALAHLAGLWRLLLLARQADVVHFQWTLLPVLDGAAMWLLRKFRPVLLTVHDSVPFNGHRMPFFQRFAADWPIKLAQRVIVHSKAAKQELVRRGIAAEKIAVVPHGPLPLKTAPAKKTGAQKAGERDARWTFAMFGYLKPYKGIDLVIEAAGLLRDAFRGRARFVIAGSAQMDIAPLRARIVELGIADMVELRVGYLSNEALAGLLDDADCILFPYRQIDASGAYYMAKPLGKWIIASAVGVFADDVVHGQTGTLVPPSDSHALAQALEWALENRAKPVQVQAASSWRDIGALTKLQYRLANEQIRPRAAKSCTVTEPAP